MDHKFEGFIDGIGTQRLDFISSVLKEQGFEDGTVRVEAVGKAGDNYGSDVRRIIAERNGKSFRMIAKIKLPQNSTSGAIDVLAVAFHNENLMYTQVLPKCTELEKQAGIPESERLNYATHFGALLEEPNVMILLEDLQVTGYTTLNRYKPLPDDAIKILLKTIARLHAYAFVLKQRAPETLTALKNKLANLWELLFQDVNMKTMFESIENDILFAVDNKYQDYIRGKVCNFPEITSAITKEDIETDYYVIQHGDAWTNNVLFKLQDEKIISCCMVDYQGSKAASPVSDVSYMIFNCTDYNGRSLHYYQWIDYYHLQLDRTLNHFGLEASLVYPRDRLDADLKRYGKLSLPLAAFTNTFLVRDDAEAAKVKGAMGENKDVMKLLDASRIMNSDSSTIAKFKATVGGIIQSHIEFGLC